MDIIAATGNAGKLKEIQAILKSHRILSLKDIEFTREIVEDGTTFQQNAEIKARAVWGTCRPGFTGAWVLADDSGLEVEALGGRPGVLSARYAGEYATSAEKMAKLLDELQGVPAEKRAARFVCAMVLLKPDGTSYTAHGFCRGRIGFEAAGGNGFGYDPIFLVEESGFQKTMAELPEEEKNKLSHRRKALEGILRFLEY